MSDITKKQVKLSVCTNECPRRGTMLSVGDTHVHIPEGALVSMNDDDTATCIVPADHLTDDASAWASDMPKRYPWFFGEGDRAPIASIKP